jgi:iron(III) transport system ATP-binding protein
MTFLVEVRGLALRYGEVWALRGVDLEVPRGGITGLVGPSGCGKTSLLRAIAGFEVPLAGEIRVGGRQVAGPHAWVPPEERRVGMVFQQGALFPHLSVRRNVHYGVARRRDAADRVAQVLDLVGLTDLGDRHPDELSGGQQQRVALARALAPEPDVVLLDEPFANLDAGLRTRLREDVRAILAAAGMTAVLVTHDQEEALSIADRVAVMEDGRLLQVGTPAEVYERPATARVARFLGDGQLLPCVVEAGWARCALGRVPTGAAAGPGLLLVRPEDVEVRVNGDGGEAGGTVVDERFFGHDVLHEVALDSGERVCVRQLSSDRVALGARVRLALRQRRLRVLPVEPYECQSPPTWP